MTVVCSKHGRALWVLLRVGLVLRELLYCLGRWVGGGESAGDQSPTCGCYRLIISESVY